MALRFIWDPKKALANEKKHGVSFAKATTAFDDDLSLTISDPDHSVSEERLLVLGMSSRHRLLVGAHVAWKGSIRIINARQRPTREQPREA